MALPLLLVVILVTVLPLIWAFSISFFRYGIFDTFPAFVGLHNYKLVFQDNGLKLSFQITSLWAFLKVSLEFIISFYLAISLRKTSMANRAILLLIGLGWFMPSFISVSAWRAFIQGYGSNSIFNMICNLLFGTTVNISTQPAAAFIATLLVSVWLSIPMSTMIIIAMLQSIPEDVEGMLLIDGARDSVLSRILFGQIRYLLIPYYFFQLARAFKGFSTAFLLSGDGPLLPGGFTPQTIVGSTSFLGIVLYRKFSIEEDYGVLSAYSAVVGLIMFLWLIAALSSRARVPKRHRYIMFLAAASQLFAGYYLGLGMWPFIVAMGYLFSIALIPKFKKAFRLLSALLVITDAGLCIYSVYLWGWKGINPATFLAVPAIILSLRYKIPVFNYSIPKVIKGILKWIPGVISLSILIYIALLALSEKNSVLPEFTKLTLGNFSTVFFKHGLWLNLLNTLKIALYSIIILFVTALPFSYLYSRRKNRGTSLMMLVILFGGIYTGMHTLLPLYMIFNKLNLLNSLIGIAIVVASQAVPLTVITMSSFFSRIPEEFREVAKLEGMTEGIYFSKIVLPLSLPVIAGIFVYVLVSSWNAFTLPLVFIDKSELMPFSLKVFSYAGEIGSFYTRWNLFGAASLIGIIPLLFLYKFNQRLLYSKNLAEGGITYE
ncbi:ABC transporter permease [Kosmotoga arenicorallina S304]|uniref:ABC transporter permease n=1 Tax=Kosmotoga arenicorallina S304 TaxID=1453497 RepID=A0A176JXK1_9BACT|nr:ABC transporter permease subunit [Kosmotoga arenicorallina]OAA28449.1 ABC transporter permease [Kosmotoga arenicorallina S304]